MPNTHWDREWVMTKDEYRVRLVQLIDTLRDLFNRFPSFIFVLDGQAIAIEDYLSVSPEMRGPVSDLVRTRRLVLGPWYVLADLFLENSESLIRNLLMGSAAVRSLGGDPLGVGYVPDQFGAPASLPAFLAGFGIGYASLGRGSPFAPDDCRRAGFIWGAADGACVLAVNHGYGNGIFLSYPDIWTDITQPSSLHPDPEAVMRQFLIEAGRQRQHSGVGPLYFSVGADHMEPRESLMEIVRYINSRQSNYHLKLGTIEDYIKQLEASGCGQEPPLYQGEFRGSAESPMDLGGTLSARVDLKLANYQCQLLLQRVVEPLCVMAELTASAGYPASQLRSLWARLLANHAHDSICGSTIDEVYVDVKQRFHEVLRAAHYLAMGALRGVVGHLDLGRDDPDAVPLVVVNPLGPRMSGPVRAFVRVPRLLAHSSYEIVDDSGRSIPAVVHHITNKRKDLESVFLSADRLALLLSKQPEASRPPSDIYSVLQVDFVADDVPPTGYKTWWIRPRRGGEIGDSVQSASVTATGRGMQNTFLQVCLNTDGSFDLIDRRTGKTYPRLHALIDREDIGDTYDHQAFDTPEDYDSRQLVWHWVLTNHYQHRITYRGTATWALPSAALANRRAKLRRSTKLTLFVTLYAGIPRVDVQLCFTNVWRDHCLRILFDTDLRTDYVDACDHFNVIPRTLAPRGTTWRDEPFDEFLDVSDGSQGLCILTKGLHAYQGLQGGRGASVLLTLLRSVGQLGTAAGANYPTPLAQCMGPQSFEYAIVPHNGNWRDGDCIGASQQYHALLLAEADLQHHGSYPAQRSLLSIEPSLGGSLFYSCLKHAEGEDGYVLRLWNAHAARSVTLATAWPTTPTPVTLSESPIALASRGNSVDLGDAAICTILLPRNKTSST